MEAEVSGSMLKCFAQACINLEYVVGDKANQVCARVNMSEWYPLSDYMRICNLTSNIYRDPVPILERTGVEMMNIWYHEGPTNGKITSFEPEFSLAA